MKDIFCVDYRDSIRSVVRKEIKVKYGIKVPKSKDREKHKVADDCQNKSKYFGVLLEKAPSRNIKDDQYFAIPLFLVDAFEYLKDHLTVEGLFRKSGSAGRQKILREVLERDGTFANCDFLHPHDIASLVKQFFRDLPNPLFTTQLSPVFLKCINLQNMMDSNNALLLCILLLPDEHLRVLKYLVKCINEVANHSVESKMTVKNLGIVFAPNLLCISGKDRNSEKAMRETTKIVDYVFKNPDKIGMVSDEIMKKAASIHVDGGTLTSSGDEIEDNYRSGRTLENHRHGEKKRDRSKSITGFLRRGFKSADRNTGKGGPTEYDKDLHGMVISPQRWVRNNSVHKFSSSAPEKTYIEYSSSSSIGSNGSAKRQNSGKKTNFSPVKKSPRLAEDSHLPVISLPVLKTLPNQLAMSPRKKLHNIEPGYKVIGNGTPVLPSKFDLSRGRNRTQTMDVVPSHISYGMEIDLQEENRLPQSRISRQTQKPHVKKTRRASSLDRRRARYQSGTPGNRRQLPKTPLSDNSEVSPFHDENLTVNIAFMEDSCMSMDVDASTLNTTSRYATRNSKVSKWKTDGKKGSSGVADQKKLRRKSISTPDVINVERKSVKKGSTQRKVRKSLSLVEASTSNKLPEQGHSEKTKVTRTRSAVPTSSKKVTTLYSTTPQIGIKPKRQPIGVK